MKSVIVTIVVVISVLTAAIPSNYGDDNYTIGSKDSQATGNVDLPPEEDNSRKEEQFPSNETNLELNEGNRWSWGMRRKPTHHSVYSHVHNPRCDKPSINQPSYNQPDDDSPSVYNEEDGWHSKPLTDEPVWGIESSEETKVFKARRKRISQIKCEKYGRPVTEIVRALPLSLNADVVPYTVQKCNFNAAKLIVGGVAADIGEFPHMAAIGFRANDGSIMWNCGGSLISEQYVMTAGHCSNTTFGDPVLVRLGEHNLVDDNDEAQPEDYEVEEVIRHPRYKPPVKYNDIALLRLQKPVRMSDKIRPACLSSSESLIDKPIAIGWGRTDFVGRLSDVLMKVGLSIIDNSQCNSLYKRDKTTSTYFKQGIADSMLCAGELAGGKDTCFGDSGGPLQVTEKGNQCVYHIIGITSFGKVCGAANSPGVYTRVSKFLPWIEKTVWG